MLETSVTIFVCSLSHVRHICGCLPAPVRKLALVVMINTDKLESLRTKKKTLLQALPNFSCVAK